MTIQRRRFLPLVVFPVALPAWSRSSLAKGYPTRPLTLVVPYAPGGSADTLPRIVAERMAGILGSPILVANVTGAAGSIGTARVAQAQPDGYTFGLGTWSTHVANGAVYKLPYDVRTDFEPIAQLAFSPLVFATSSKVPAHSLTELIAWLKVNPDPASLATNGAGSIMHLAGTLLRQRTGTRFNVVPYRGSAPALQDLLSGRVDLYLGLPADVVPHVRNGAVRIHAIASSHRSTAATHIPTTDEAGLPGFHVSAWFGLWAPKDTDTSVIARLNMAARAALADPAVRHRLQQEMLLEIPQPEQQTPQALRRLQDAEIEKWWPVIRAADIKGG
ncbi:MAG: tripartite tricarboxylate transporter substrate-binding protein [Reyranellaceae bacterium]